MFLKKTLKSLLAFVLVFLMVTPFSPIVNAAYGPDQKCQSYVKGGGFESLYLNGSGKTITLELKDLAINTKYSLSLHEDGGGGDVEFTETTSDTGSATFTFTVPDALTPPQDVVNVRLLKEGKGLTECSFGTYVVKEETSVFTCVYKITQERGGKTCFYDNNQNSCMLENVPIKAQVQFLENGQPFANKPVSIQVTDGLGWLNETTDSEGWAKPSRTFDIGNAQSYNIKGSDNSVYINYRYCDGYPFSTQTSCTKNGADLCLIDETEITPTPTDPAEAIANPYEICSQIPEGAAKSKCINCAGGPAGQEGVWTAIGCIKREPKAIIKSLMRIGLGMGGGVALLSVLAGGFILSTSQGDPQKANQAKEIITNAVIGILFIIFSVVILQFIGVTIFNIPGFGTIPQ